MWVACTLRRGHGRWPVFPKLFSVIPTSARNTSTTLTTNTSSKGKQSKRDGLILLWVCNLIVNLNLKDIVNRSNRFSTTISQMDDSWLGHSVSRRRFSSTRSCFSNSVIIFILLITKKKKKKLKNSKSNRKLMI